MFHVALSVVFSDFASQINGSPSDLKCYTFRNLKKFGKKNTLFFIVKKNTISQEVTKLL